MNAIEENILASFRPAAEEAAPEKAQETAPAEEQSAPKAEEPKAEKLEPDDSRLWKRPAMPSVWMTSSSAATITEKSNSKRAVLAGSTEEPVSDRPFIFSLAAAR